jgi:hypothetical protein
MFININKCSKFEHLNNKSRKKKVGKNPTSWPMEGFKLGAE